MAQAVIGAWVDYERYTSGTRSSDACYSNSTGSQWTEGANNDYASVFNQYGALISSNCNIARPIACCRSAHSNSFRGFTVATFNGNLGGIVGANARCSAEFPNTWLCTQSEYFKAESYLSPGTAGAWIDYERYSSGTRSSDAWLREQHRLAMD